MKITNHEIFKQPTGESILVNNGNIKEKNSNNIKNQLNEGLVATESREKREITEDHVLEAIKATNKSYYNKYTRFEFSVHEVTKDIIVKVYDRETDELIREIPPEKILDMVAVMWELAGILVDDRA